MTDYDQIELPKDVIPLIKKLNPPERLVRHLKLVFDTAFKLVHELKSEWPNLKLDVDSVLFGAATHDIGKINYKKELFQKGKKHEKAGKKLLVDYGISKKLARFTVTHGNWEGDDLTIEDLLVTLADKVWKGKRIIELEEKVIKMLSLQLQIEFWDIYLKFDDILSQIASEADGRIIWQSP